MQFDAGYAAGCVCSPTRVSIMTGKHPARLNATDWFGAPQPSTAKNHWTRNKPLLPALYEEQMPLEEITLAEALKEAGYTTFFAGKWHMGPEGFWPEDQGFDVNKGGCEKGSPPGGDRYFSPYENPRLDDGPPGEYLPLRLADETCRFIKANRKAPFLAYLSFYSVHTPLMTTPELKDKYEKKKADMELPTEIWGKEGDRKVRLVQEHAVYAGMVEAMDAAIGRVLDELDRLKLSENTVVFFMSDNGGLSTSEGHPTSNLPLRAGKGWLYEGGIREPWLVRWPGVTQSGSVCRTPVISMDFYPTMLEMAGLELRPDQHRDGISLVTLLKGQKMDPRSLFWHYPHYGNQGGTPGAAIRDGDFKLIWFFEDNRLELYDLKEDIGETTNLAGRLPKKADALMQQLQRRLVEVDARLPVPNARVSLQRRSNR